MASLTQKTAPTQPAPAASAASQVDIVFWQSIAASHDPIDFQAYLARFPEGSFTILAQRRLAALEHADATRPQDPPLISSTSTEDKSWIADPRTGCRVYNGVPGPKESITWNGDCQNGLAEGKGILQWFVNGVASERYEGDWRDGKQNGHGVFTDAKGDHYDGEFLDDKMNGYGVFVWANGDRYEGDWRNAKQNGHGVFMDAKGGRYEGEWSDGKQDHHRIRADGKSNR